MPFEGIDLSSTPEPRMYFCQPGKKTRTSQIIETPDMQMKKNDDSLLCCSKMRSMFRVVEALVNMFGSCSMPMLLESCSVSVGSFYELSLTSSASSEIFALYRCLLC